jgi:hypothetical protein
MNNRKEFTNSPIIAILFGRLSPKRGDRLRNRRIGRDSIRRYATTRTTSSPENKGLKLSKVYAGSKLPYSEPEDITAKKNNLRIEMQAISTKNALLFKKFI